MRILIDLQGCQSEGNGTRGIGRYTKELIKNIMQLKGNNEVVLLANARLKSMAHTLNTNTNQAKKNIYYCEWIANDEISYNFEQNTSARKIAKLLRQYAIDRINPDLVLIPSVFEGFAENAVVEISDGTSNIPTAVVLYDLIPLLNPDIYLTALPRYKEFYMGGVELIRKADIVLTISNYAKEEALKNLNIDRNRIVSISTGINTIQFNTKPIENPSRNKEWELEKNGYILYSGAYDPRKNLKSLIVAYKELPKHLQSTYRLVIAGKYMDAEINELIQLTKQTNIAYLGYVTDEELIWLYQNCKLFVFPSKHEGFGMPALEAMCCGAVVIGSATTSIPEVIANKNALFNPNSIRSIKDKIEECITSETKCTELLKSNLEQIRNFSWEKTAQIALDEIKKVANTRKEAAEWQQRKNKTKEVYTKLISEIKTILNEHPSENNEEKINLVATYIEHIERQTEWLVRKPTDEHQVQQWMIEGPFDSSYSLAKLNRELVKSMQQIGINISIKNTEGPGDYTPNMNYLKDHPQIYKLLSTRSDKENMPSDICSRNLYPPRVADMKSRINMLHCYGWEETGFPNKWVREFNDHLQGITVMSKHVKKILQDNGVHIPIGVTGLGVEQNKSELTELQIEAKRFKYLHVSSCFPRKGIDELLEAYGNLFKIDDDVSLIIKTFNNPHNKIEDKLNALKLKNQNYPHVHIINYDLKESEMNWLYKISDVLVLPSYCEGFGLPIAEAMNAELPVITTNWSGQLELCNNETAWLVDYKFEQAKTHLKQHCSAWARPIIEDLQRQMETLYSISEAEKASKTHNAKLLVANICTWEECARKNKKFVEELDIKNNKSEIKIGWISTWNTKCGIANYSKNLVDELCLPLKVFAPYADQLVHKDEDHVIRCWQVEKDQLDNLESALNRSDINAVVIQFNFGFFNLDVLNQFIIKLRAQQVIVILIMHSTREPKHDKTKKLRMLAAGLKSCNRILVHTIADMNRLKNLEIIDNITLFPHGVVFANAERSSQNKKTKQYIIGSFGYFLPNKGLLELIQAMKIIKSSGLNIQLNMYNSEYPIPESAKLIEEAKELIKKNQLDQQISLDASFQCDEEITKKIAACDLMVFPYQKSDESSSAAVRTALGLSVPILVTPLEIFDEIQYLSFKIDGVSPENIADGIVKTLESLYGELKQYRSFLDILDQWKFEYSFSSIGYQLEGMITAYYQEDQSDIIK